MAIVRFVQLEVWQEAHQLVLQVYRTTKGLPGDGRFGLISQMRRAAVSVPANIAEGFKRRGTNDKSHFYNIAESSLEELRYYFILCQDLHYDGHYDALDRRADRVARMLSGLVTAVKA